MRWDGGDGVGRITRSNDGKGASLHLRDLSVTLDDALRWLDDTDIAIKPGERVLVAGESGTGKSTLVRAIAGLWPCSVEEIAKALRRVGLEHLVDRIDDEAP
jgi:vitamin B12/bleomycin/antimicrobial peptide transport system ATP-binding/permease protein